MSNSTRDGRQSKPEDEPARGKKSSFAWEFRSEETPTQAPATPSVNPPRSNPHPRARRTEVAQNSPAVPRASATRASASGAAPRARRAKILPDGGRFGPARANFVRDQLDLALDRWWADGELPPLALLRDGLLLLEAGGAVSESQRTLLLRAALAYGRGVQTALRHQIDRERVALVLAEALVEWEVPLDAESLTDLVGDDEQTRDLLVTELERSRVLLTGEARRRAEVALAWLSRAAKDSGKAVLPAVPRTHAPARVTNGQRTWRQILLILLLVASVGFVVWQQRREVPQGMIAMPAATYALYAADGAQMTGVPLAAYFIDEVEVTNRAYRGCVDAGACRWPLAVGSVTRADYFINPAFDAYPVVNVTQVMAAEYCEWQGLRLPTAEEWQAAASVSPTTGQAFRYPWGETFDAQRANSDRSGVGDTVVVGSFRPSGDSAAGLADMAGNVAEWTGSLVDDAQSGPLAVVKGGSFRDGPDALFVGAKVLVPQDEARPNIGFRCAQPPVARVVMTAARQRSAACIVTCRAFHLLLQSYRLLWRPGTESLAHARELQVGTRAYDARIGGCGRLD